MFLKSFKQDTVLTPQSGIIDGSNATGALNVPVGTTAQRPTKLVAGAIRYNTTTNQTEIYSGISWVGITSQTYSASYSCWRWW